MMDLRKWRYPIWYYGMILATTVCAVAGAYFRGNRVQTDLQIDRMILGSVLAVFLALATWAFRTLLNEVRKISLGISLIFDMEDELHPNDGKIIRKYYRQLREGRRNGEFREI